MKGCSKFQYTEFNLEKQSIEFASDEGEDILIVIPITDDTPKCIKNKLNEIISSSYDEALQTGILECCMPAPLDMLLSARMQVDYRNEDGVKYYIVITISDFERGAFWIDKSIRIDKRESRLSKKRELKHILKDCFQLIRERGTFLFVF